MAAPTLQQMHAACQQAVQHVQHLARAHSATPERDTAEHVHVEVFSSPHLAPGVATHGDWYEVGILYSDPPGTALGVYLDAGSGRVKIEQPLLDVPPAPPTAGEHEV